MPVPGSGDRRSRSQQGLRRRSPGPADGAGPGPGGTRDLVPWGPSAGVPGGCRGEQGDARTSGATRGRSTAERSPRRSGCDPSRGLEDEAARRLAADGPNEIRTRRPVSLARSVAAQLRDTLILVLLGAAVLTAATGDWIDCGVILLVVVVNTTLGVVQERRAILGRRVPARARRTERPGVQGGARPVAPPASSSWATCSAWPPATSSGPTRACCAAPACRSTSRC